jgi:hypothetical protein
MYNLFVKLIVAIHSFNYEKYFLILKSYNNVLNQIHFWHEILNGATAMKHNIYSYLKEGKLRDNAIKIKIREIYFIYCKFFLIRFITF